jgi:hypothetical protein
MFYPKTSSFLFICLLTLLFAPSLGAQTLSSKEGDTVPEAQNPTVVSARSQEQDATLETNIPQDLADISSEMPANSPLLVQASSANLSELQEELRIPPLIEETAGQRTYPPSLTFGIPSGFGPGWGDLYISASGATAGKARDGQTDGSISMGFGLGDPVDLVGLSFTYNMGSINNFGQTGTFDLSGSRIVYADSITSVGVAAGWSAFAQYSTGISSEGIASSSVWGTVTSYSYLQPNDPINKMPLLLSLGVGGGYYRQDPASTGVFGGVGLQLAPQLGVGLQWSGVGLNLGLSFVPVPTIPLTLTATGADLTDNSPGGTRFILSLSYGFNFLPPKAQ